MPFIRSKPPRYATFDMGADQIANALDLICRGSKEARGPVSPGMREPDINRTVSQGDQAYGATDWKRFEARRTEGWRLQPKRQ